MKILVTGAKGQIGSELVQLGKKQGIHLIATDHVELDITRWDVVNDFIRSEQPDVIVNAAGYTAVDKAEKEVDQAYAINRDGPRNLARACAETKLPLLHISTDYIFDGSKETPYTETDSPNPMGVYGKSKLEGERAITANLERYYILRVAWVFGVNGHNFIRSMLRLARENDTLKVVSDQKGSPTWARDIAHVLLTLAERHANDHAIPWGTYHYVGAPQTTWQAFAKTIFETAQQLGILDKLPEVEPISTKNYPTPAKRPQNSVLDCARIVKALNIDQPDWKRGLKNVLNTWEQP